MRWSSAVLAGIGVTGGGGCSRPEEGDGAESRFEVERIDMVDAQLARRGIDDEAVLDAMRTVPRERFVPRDSQGQAYGDHALAIGYGQTISQPYVVAFMTAALRLRGDERVLEIGTGSGYQAAVLAEIVAHVYTSEIVPALAERSAAVLADLGYENVTVRAGDGYRGWRAQAPFDAIMLTAAPDHIPEPLLEQLAVGGRMILPVGGFDQELTLIERTEEGTVERRILAVRFVPMTGEAQAR